MHAGVDRHELRERLVEEFPGADAEHRVVARMAGDLADSGQYEHHTGSPLTVDRVVEHLYDAPVREEHDDRVAARWNWWMGSLELAFGGYGQFRVREWEPDPE